MSWRVEALLAGKAQEFRRQQQSAIAKLSVSGPVEIGSEGLAGDEQADRSAHGGPDMAVHLYPLDHHEAWRRDIGDHLLLGFPGAFGSNLAVRGLTEQQVHIGGRFRLGSALLEISQPRQPCWKIEHRFGQNGMVARILQTGRCGWYFRVLETGIAQAGDELEMVESGLTQWSVARVFSAIWGTTDKPDPALLTQIAALPSLSGKLRAKISARVVDL